ncbi:MAG: hypothetical protein ACRDHZ_04025 [Ktedonobacteraceae bacterium]
MNLDECFFASLVTEPGDISRFLGQERDLRFDRMTAREYGLLLGQPEIYASRAARDAVLGPCGTFLTFVALSWAEIQASAFSEGGIAIGHQLGDAKFDFVATPVVNNLARHMVRVGMPVSITIARVRFLVAVDLDGEIIVDRSKFSPAIGKKLFAPTAGWIRQAFADSLLSRREVVI